MISPRDIELLGVAKDDGSSRIDQVLLGRRLAEARRMTPERLGQVDIAEAMGVHKQTVSNWERGTKIPSMQQIVKLCDLLELSVDYALGLTDKNDVPNYGLRRPNLPIGRAVDNLRKRLGVESPAAAPPEDIAARAGTLETQMSIVVECIEEIRTRLKLGHSATLDRLKRAVNGG